MLSCQVGVMDNDFKLEFQSGFSFNLRENTIGKYMNPPLLHKDMS